MMFDLLDLLDKKGSVSNRKVYLHIFTLFVIWKYDNFAFFCRGLGGIHQALLLFA